MATLEELQLSLQALRDEAEIRGAVQNWALWRDTGNWEQLRRCYAAGARVQTTWMQGTAEEFIAASQAGFARPQAPRATHSIGACSVQIAGERALAETRMILLLRASLDGVEVDATAWGRFVDWFVRHEGRWVIARRHSIHEKDRLDPVNPAATLKLDEARLATFPQGYRHLAYLQSHGGASITPDLALHNGPGQETLYAAGRDWLAGKN
ncbi:MAG TPA: nuclear transport factor 2 family protein [Burkholderiales bacterium]|jgi:hypothetical protein